jgi:proteic killer suppression protein
MIRSFKHKGLKRFSEKGDPSKLSIPNHERIARMLAALDQAREPGDMRLPGYNFHPLQGDAKGRYAVTISGNWRITFAWNGEDAIDVDMEDYH